MSLSGDRDGEGLWVGGEWLPRHVVLWSIAEAEEALDDTAFRLGMFDGQPMAAAVAQFLLAGYTLPEVARMKGIRVGALYRLLDIEAGLVEQPCCEVCGTLLVGRRPDARFCGGRCRVTAHRRRTG
jgi:hypothetical protein